MKSRVIQILLVAAIVFVLAALLLPVSGGKRREPEIACLSNVKQLAMSLLMYSNDYGDRLPAAADWMDSIDPYVKNDAVFHCPKVEPKSPEAYGYAIRARLSGANTAKIKDQKTEPLDFDSDLLERNASTDAVILPNFTRHPGQNVGFLDGHAHRFIQRSDWN